VTSEVNKVCARIPDDFREIVGKIACVAHAVSRAHAETLRDCLARLSDIEARVMGAFKSAMMECESLNGELEDYQEELRETHDARKDIEQLKGQAFLERLKILGAREHETVGELRKRLGARDYETVADCVERLTDERELAVAEVKCLNHVNTQLQKENAALKLQLVEIERRLTCLGDALRAVEFSTLVNVGDPS
jgi:hypothetical protein